MTALTTAARKAGEGWDVADGSAESVLGKLEFATEVDGLLSTGKSWHQKPPLGCYVLAWTSYRSRMLSCDKQREEQQ